MSTSETVTFNAGPCPCGQGHVAKHVTSQDNPWSTADIAYSIECPQCSTEWRLDFGALVLRSSEVAHCAASAAEKRAAASLRVLVQEVTTRHFAAFTAPTKKAEHAELERLGLTNMSYRQYLEHRRHGGTIATAAAPARNPNWLSLTAAAQGRVQDLRALNSAHLEAKKARQQAYEQVIRRRIS